MQSPPPVQLTMRRSLAWCLTGLAGLLAGGCLHLHQEIALDRDGTGRFSLRLSLPQTVYTAAIAPADSPLGKRWDRYFHPDSGLAALNGETGLRVDSYRVFEQEGRLYVHVSGKIANLAQAVEAGVLGPWKLQTGDDGATTLRWQPTAAGRPGEAWTDTLAGVRLRLVIKPSGTVVDTNATTREGNTLVWDFDGDKAPGGLVEPPSLWVTYR